MTTTEQAFNAGTTRLIAYKQFNGKDVVGNGNNLLDGYGVDNASIALGTVSAADLTNGVIFKARGNNASGDGAGRDFIYRSSGRSSIAIDNGFYFAGPGSTDYFEATDKFIARADHFGASGRGEVATTGAITSGQQTLVVASASTFEVGHGIAIYGAGTKLGSLNVLVTKITAKNGATLTLRDAATTTVSGAVVEHSDSEAIQECINAILYPGHQEGQPIKGLVVITGGVFYCHDTIHQGYGETFKQCHIRGAGSKFTGTWNFAGTALVARFSDRPLLAINGARSNTISDMHLLGKNRTWVESRGLGGLTGTYADLATTDWLNPALTSESPNCNSRYAPYAGIAIDPYAGTAPGTPYPNMAIPSWMSNQTQYGKVYSSNVRFSNVSAEGFVVGCVVQPSGADSNGDYVHFDNCYINYNVYGFSVCNSQARLMSFLNGTINSNHTGVVTGVHGAQVGKPSFLFTNVEMGACIRVFDIPTLSYGGSPTFDHCYGEIVYRLGDGVASSSGPTGITFNQCEWGFTAVTNGVPRDIIKNTGPTIFRGGSLAMTMPVGQEEYPAQIHFDVPSTQLKFEGNPTIGVGLGSITSSAIKNSINGTGGVVARNLGTSVTGDWTIGGRWNMVTGASSGVADFNNDTVTSNRALGIHIYAKRARAQALANRDQGFLVNSEVGAYDKTTNGMGYGTGGISIATSGRTVTITNIYSALFDAAVQAGGCVGDIAYDGATGTVFVVKALTLGATATLKLYALTNFTKTGNLNSAFTATGILYCANCRRYTPEQVTRCTLNTGSANLTPFQRPDSYTTYINDSTSGVAVNDYISVVQEADYWNSTAGAKITAINNTGSGTVTLVAAPVYNQSLRRVECCVRAPSANE